MRCQQYLKMRKIIFFIAGLFFTQYVIAQQAPSSEVVTAVMPKGAIKLTQDQLVRFTSKNYKSSAMPLNKENTYQLDGILISFWDLRVNQEFKKSLPASQKEILEVLRLNDFNKVNYSKIITVNNKQFLVYDYEIEDECYLRFQSEFNKQNKNICGLIQYKKPDEAKAEEALQTFLQSVHFKE